VPLIWLLMLGCTDAGPMEPCASTGVWDMETGGSFNSIHAALATGAKEICLGPGTYALSCEPLVGPAFSLIGAGSEVTEVRRPDCYDYIELDMPGGYRLETLALTTADFFFNSNDTTELVDVVIRDTLTRGPSFSVAGPLSIDGLEVRDNDLGSASIRGSAQAKSGG
jgi:hypothetical protein